MGEAAGAFAAVEGGQGGPMPRGLMGGRMRPGAGRLGADRSPRAPTLHALPCGGRTTASKSAVDTGSALSLGVWDCVYCSLPGSVSAGSAAIVMTGPSAAGFGGGCLLLLTITI